MNLRGSFLVTKGAIPHMTKNDYGRILLIASVAGKEGNAGMAAYSTSKAGVIGLVRVPPNPMPLQCTSPVLFVFALSDSSAHTRAGFSFEPCSSASGGAVP